MCVIVMIFREKKHLTRGSLNNKYILMPLSLRQNSRFVIIQLNNDKFQKSPGRVIKDRRVDSSKKYRQNDFEFTYFMSYNAINN